MARNLVVDRMPTRSRLRAARGLLDDYSHSEPRDWSTWSVRLAGALTSIVGVAEEAVELNSEMADILESILLT